MIFFNFLLFFLRKRVFFPSFRILISFSFVFIPVEGRAAFLSDSPLTDTVSLGMGAGAGFLTAYSLNKWVFSFSQAIPEKGDKPPLSNEEKKENLISTPQKSMSWRKKAVIGVASLAVALGVAYGIGAGRGRGVKRNEQREEISLLKQEVFVSPGEEIPALKEKSGVSPEKTEDVSILLREAVKEGNLERVQFLLEKDPDFSLSPRKGEEGLFHLISRLFIPENKAKDFKEMIRFLIKKGLDINEVSPLTGITPLNSALSCGKFTAIKLLLKAGGDLKKISDFNLMFLDVFNKKQILSYLILKKPSLTYDSYQGNILHLLSRTFCPIFFFTENIEFLKLGIKRGINVNAQDLFGRTPLFLAVGKGYVEGVDALLEAGADPNLCTFNELRNPLHLLINTIPDSFYYPFSYGENHFRNLKIFEYLIQKKVNINAVDKYGTTPLLYASCKGNNCFFQKLLEAGADPNIADFEKKEVPLHKVAKLPCHMSKIEMIKKLLEKEAHIDAVNEAGHTPLSLAVFQGEEGVVKFLLSQGADLRKVLPLSIKRAVTYNQVKTLEALLDRDPCATYGAHQDTILHSIFQEFTSLEVERQLMRLAFDKGCDVNAKNARGRRPIDVFLSPSNCVNNWSYRKELVSLFVNHPFFNPNLEQGIKPFYIGDFWQISSLSSLVERGAKINAKKFLASGVCSWGLPAEEYLNYLLGKISKQEADPQDLGTLGAKVWEEMQANSQENKQNKNYAVPFINALFLQKPSLKSLAAAAIRPDRVKELANCPEEVLEMIMQFTSDPEVHQAALLNWKAKQKISS